jgi:DHA1 family tetracycline resistance protein-like MFS transporter
MKNKRSFFTALLVIFIDYIGIGLIYPLFSSMIFDPKHPLLPQDLNGQTRGLYLGILLALMPLVQFFTAPIWGSLSDSYGRKKPLLASLTIAVFGYIFLWGGAFYAAIEFLFLGRALTGFASGNTAIIQASIADISDKQDKAKYFAYYSMAMGSGFTLGPFIGGMLSTYSYDIPFLFTLAMLLINLCCALFLFKETHENPKKTPIKVKTALHQLTKAFTYKGLRIIFLASFLHNFGWSYFFEFIPIYLINKFSFTSLDLGTFYGLAGAFYALSTGLLIQPILKRLTNEFLFFAGNLLTGLTILCLLLLPSIGWLWVVLFLICFFVAVVTPTSTTIVSNATTERFQGESLGIMSSVNAAALVLSPLFSGSFVGAYPSLSIKVGGSFMILASLVLIATLYKGFKKVS